MPSMYRAYLQKLIKDGRIEIDGKVKKASYILIGGEEITINIPEPITLTIEPQNIPLDII